MTTYNQEEKKLLRDCEAALGVVFRAKRLLLSALVHPSFPHPVKHTLEDFERMEFLGDSILNLVTSMQLYNQFEQATEGSLSQFRAACVSRKILAKAARRLKLDRFVRLGKGEQNLPESGKDKILADSFEAIIAAIYFDRGLRTAREFILRHLESFMSPASLNRRKHSPKNLLQEWVQKHYKALPKYQVRPTKTGFAATALIKGKQQATAEGHSKKEAQEKAARLLLKKLKQKPKKK